MYNNFYSTETLGKTMLLVNILRCLFIICVPIFLILSGYLMNQKKFNKEYCKKISKILLTYFLCSVVCSVSISIIFENNIPSIKNCLFQVIDFVGAPYAWYVNMYIGLYFFIPFLNTLWNNLEKENKKWLIIILFIFVISPTILNLRWNIIPNYWCGIAFPILYYFVGCYLKEFPIKISIYKNILILILLIVLFGLFNYIKCYNNVFEIGIYSENFSFEAFFVSLFFANLIFNLKIEIKSKKLSKFIIKLSNLTFASYLLSAIFDNLFYSKIMPHLATTFHERLAYMIPFVLTIIICSFLCAYIIDLLEKLLKKITNWIITIIKKLKENLKKMCIN